MPKEMFPVKKAGDGLSHKHVNDLGRIVGNLSGGNQGSGLLGSHGWITGVASLFSSGLKQARVVDETSTKGVYNVLIRYWDETASEWKQEENEYLLDVRCYTKDSSTPQRGPTLVCKDLLSVRWDKQRDTFVPVQMLFSNSRWCWVDESIPARNKAAVSSLVCKLVEETLNAAGTAIAWTYLKDDDDAEVSVRVFNGFPDVIPAGLHARIGWDSIGQYEVKGVPCADDEELDLESSASSSESFPSSASSQSSDNSSASSASSQSSDNSSASSTSSQSPSSASSPSSVSDISSASSPSSQSPSSASSPSSSSTHSTSTGSTSSNSSSTHSTSTGSTSSTSSSTTTSTMGA